MKGYIAGRIMLHPLLVTALVLLISNDHFLKEAHPSWITGKLSDFEGLVVFPLMVLSILDLTIGVQQKRGRMMTVAILAMSGAVFAAIQVMPLAADAYRHVVGVLQYPFRAIGGAASLANVRHVADPSDLAALPALLGVYFVAKRALDTIPEVPGHNPIGT